MTDQALVPEGTFVDDIDLSFVPTPRDTLTQREVGEELLVIDEETGLLHALNPIGAIVWDCFDGETDLEALTEEIADAFGAPLETVREDVLGLTKQLASVGLLTGIAFPEHEQETGLGVGDELAPFELTDLDGNCFDLADLRGSEALLVNWSPGCGFCVRMTPELASLEQPLKEKGVRTILVSYGSEADNRALLEEHGAGFRTVLRPSDSDPVEGDPFPGMGTPSAYLLDAEGRVAAPMASGALEVPRLARQAAGIAEPEPEAAEGAKYLPASDGTCAPGATAKRERAWQPVVAYRIGEWLVGVRTSSPSADEVVGRLLAGHRVGEDPKAPVNYSVVLPSAGPGAAKDLGLLVTGATTLVRSRSPRRIALALAAYLSTLAEPVPDDLLSTHALAAVRGDTAVLLPPESIASLEQLQPRLAKVGFGLVDEPWALIDPATAELVVPESALELDLSALDTLPEPRQSKAELGRVEPGRYGLAAWYVFQSPDQDFGRAQQAAAVLGKTAVPPAELAATYDRLAPLFERVEIRAGWADFLDQLARELREL